MKYKGNKNYRKVYQYAGRYNKKTGMVQLWIRPYYVKKSKANYLDYQLAKYHKDM